MAPGSAFLNFSGPAEDRRSADCYAALFAPLDQHLCAGGDERIALIGKTGLNAYGCKPAPRRDVIAFSSSTASSISERAYVHARDAQLRLVEEAAVGGILQSFDSHIEQLRGSLRSMLGLENSGAEILFSASGTDSQLQALFLAGMQLGTPLTCIVAGSDQTGSGTAYTAGARHFATRTARGKSVLKGSHIVAADGFASLEVPFAGVDGAFRSADEMDRLVLDAVAQEIGKGRKVLLQAMHASKFGWRAPSQSCLEQIAATWPGSVQVVIDACQMRLSPERIAGFLARGYLVLFTGSKFFCGPPLSGGLLVPKTLSQSLATANEPPAGLVDYADRSDLPMAWSGVRNRLPLDPNFGQWLRWEAALAEMRAYQSLPAAYRKNVLAALAYAIPRALRSSRWLEPLAAPAGFVCDIDCGDEFSAPTIFAFVLRDENGVLDCETVAEIHRALNRDIGLELSFAATPDENGLAAKICHIGQPVKLKLPNGRSTSVLRIAIGSRTLFDAWPAGDSDRAAARILADVGTVISKIDLILKDRQPLAGRTLEMSHGQ
jgi:selenocysteine lyase/cysteine desulfurase